MIMKRFIAVLSGLLVLPAFAEVAPIYYEDVIEYVDEESGPNTLDNNTNGEDVTTQKNTATPVVPTNVSPRNTTTRTASRAIPASGTTTASGRNVTTRGTTARTTTNAATATRTATNSGATTTRRATNTATASRATTARATVARTGTTTAQPSTQNVTARRTTTTPNAARASIVQTDTVNTPLYTGRVGVRSSATTSRVPTIRMASSGTETTTTTSTAVTTSDIDELAQMTDFCKAQYMQCMDNFCNVLDDNQGRCSCSANLKNYAKTEAALAKATEDLQDAAQKIQYIGLSGDDIETLFTQTEAELKMQSTTDNTQLRNDLDKIKSLIVDAKGSNTSTTSGMGIDLSGLLDFSFNSSGFDLSGLLGNTSTSSISNQRGEELYKTATARCKASVLNSCSAQGVDPNLITNYYDLEIDKQCILYERNLNEANTQMASTVRNAQSVLQKARLMVAQQKNQYDLRGCINALDTCMQDDFVCGDNYENCLDPSGKYIVNGKVISGSTPGISGGEVRINADGTKTIVPGLYDTWSYGTGSNKNNAWLNGDLASYINANITSSSTAITDAQASVDMLKFLQKKIGYIDDNNNPQGMCISVMNKCQDLTYNGTNSNKKYIPNNEVVKEFMQRTLIQIKAAQDEILAEHAEGCISDVVSCLSQNNYNYNYSWSSTSSSSNNPSTAAVRACQSIINTCKSVTEPTTETSNDIYAWLDKVIGTTITTENECRNTANATWNSTNRKCECLSGFTASYVGEKLTCNKKTSGSIIPEEDEFLFAPSTCSSSGGTWNTNNNTCTCPDGYTQSNSTCIKP